MSEIHTSGVDEARQASFPVKILVYLFFSVVGLSVPFVLDTGVTPVWLESLLKGSAGHGQTWQFMGATAFFVAAIIGLRWTAERFNMPILDRVAYIAVSTIVIGLFGFAAVFVWAGLSDVTGSRFLASTIIPAIAIVTAAVVAAAHKSREITEGTTKPNFLYDWAWSNGMVSGGLCCSLIASFAIVALLFSLAEHHLLPLLFSNALLTERDNAGPMRVQGSVWLVLQLGWT